METRQGLPLGRWLSTFLVFEFILKWFYTNYLWQHVEECVLDDGALHEGVGRSGGEGNNIDQASLIWSFDGFYVDVDLGIS